MILALRVDVDTLRGTRLGVPRLRGILEARGLRATFYFSAGPDNMGRHLWRLARPAFLAKMLRTRAPSLYGWDILLRGTAWPGPRIAPRCAEILRGCAEAGHEIGMHAWDHHRWQARIDRLDEAAIRRESERAIDAIASAAGRAPECAAAPGWRCTEAVLRTRRDLGFRHASDVRGTCCFRPILDGVASGPIQVPTTLPTFDERVGGGVDAAAFNDLLLASLVADRPNVLVLHAEVEGIGCAELFADFLDRAIALGARMATVGEVAAAEAPHAPACAVVQGSVPGREGRVAVQGAAA